MKCKHTNEHFAKTSLKNAAMKILIHLSTLMTERNRQSLLHNHGKIIATIVITISMSQNEAKRTIENSRSHSLFAFTRAQS